jgi:hypothetical protein
MEYLNLSPLPTSTSHHQNVNGNLDITDLLNIEIPNTAILQSIFSDVFATEQNGQTQSGGTITRNDIVVSDGIEGSGPLVQQGAGTEALKTFLDRFREIEVSALIKNSETGLWPDD